MFKKLILGAIVAGALLTGGQTAKADFPTETMDVNAGQVTIFTFTGFDPCTCARLYVISQTSPTSTVLPVPTSNSAATYGNVLPVYGVTPGTNTVLVRSIRGSISYEYLVINVH